MTAQRCAAAAWLNRVNAGVRPGAATRQTDRKRPFGHTHGCTVLAVREVHFEELDARIGRSFLGVQFVLACAVLLGALDHSGGIRRSIAACTCSSALRYGLSFRPSILVTSIRFACARSSESFASDASFVDASFAPASIRCDRIIGHFVAFFHLAGSVKVDRHRGRFRAIRLSLAGNTRHSTTRSTGCCRQPDD